MSFVRSLQQEDLVEAECEGAVRERKHPLARDVRQEDLAESVRE